ncbi:MAG: dTDP-6-deoxy-L-hexose 3-O-methyltransferase, partial [Bdellovibrionota bacterium]
MKTKSEAGRRSGPHVSETTAAPEQMAARRQLLDYFEKSPLNKEDLLFNLGLYVRSSLLVKFLVLNKLYERIKTIPGNIIEFGTWWGQNLVLFENLRAIHEPFNKQRRIIGFDTFGGYTGLSDKDKASEVWSTGSYSTGKGHKDYLAELLAVHEAGNILGHVQGVHELIEGDIRKTAPQFFKDSPETLVALAYFDVGLYEPTRA